MKKVLSVVTAALMALTLLSACGAGQGAAKAEYVVLDEELSNEEYAIGFRKADQSLRDEVQKTLCEMKKDGKLAEITKTWFGKDTSTVPDSFTASNSTDDSLQKIKDKGVLILGLDDSFPPMGYQDDDGTIIGYDIDLAREVCKRMGVELKLEPIDWDSKEFELNGGKIDCIWNGMSVSDERKAAMNLSEPYMDNRQVVVSLKKEGISKLTDLKDKHVVLQAGSTAVDALEGSEVKNTIAESVEVANNVLALYELSKGTGDAVIMDEVVARYYIAHLSELNAVANKAQEK